MAIRKDVLSLAVAAVLAGTGFAMAQDGTSAAPAGAASLSLYPQSLTLDDAAAPARQPLMYGLDQIPAGGNNTVATDLDKARININGFVEVGYTYNFDHHAHVTNIGRVFDAEVGNHLQLDQVDLAIARTVDTKTWDVGGKMEWTFGTDIHNYTDNALRFYDPGQVKSAYEFDLTQAYIDINAPIGPSGLDLRVGKFVTLMGYETINPTTNPFYSHSFAFNYTIPFTQAGALLMYHINDQWFVTGGVTRGWNQSTSDNNGAIDGLFQVVWTPNAQWTITGNESIGPEDPGDQKHWRTVSEIIAQWSPNSTWSFGLDLVAGYDGANDPNGGSTDQYDATGYAAYHINDYLTANARLEYLFDGDGVGTGAAAVVGGPVDINAIEGTAGVTIKPFPKNPWGQGLEMRPEVRYDWADRKAFILGTKHDQVTVAMDIIYSF